MQANNQPIKRIKPVLVPWVLLAKYIPLQINVILAGCGFVAVLAFFLNLILGFHLSLEKACLMALAVFIIAVPFTLYMLFSKTYQLMEYRFYSDRLEYTDGFWTIVYKQIMYKNITEIALRKNIIQRFYGLGSLYFAVPSATTGILLVDVPNPEQVYKDIQDIISAAQQNNLVG